MVAAVSTFLARLPGERRSEVEQVRDVILQHLPAGYEEAVVKDTLGYADLPLDVIGAMVAAVPLDRWVAIAQEARKRPTAGKS